MWEETEDGKLKMFRLANRANNSSKDFSLTEGKRSDSIKRTNFGSSGDTIGRIKVRTDLNTINYIKFFDREDRLLGGPLGSAYSEETRGVATFDIKIKPTEVLAGFKADIIVKDGVVQIARIQFKILQPARAWEKIMHELDLAHLGNDVIIPVNWGSLYNMQDNGVIRNLWNCHIVLAMLRVYVVIVFAHYALLIYANTDLLDDKGCTQGQYAFQF